MIFVERNALALLMDEMLKNTKILFLTPAFLTIDLIIFLLIEHLRNMLGDLKMSNNGRKQCI